MPAQATAPDDSFAAIDLRRPESAALVLIDKLQLIERLIGSDPAARVVVVTARAEVASAIEGSGGRTRRYLADPAYAAQLGLGAGAEAGGDAADGSLREVEWRHIQRVLALTGGNKTAAARALQINLSTLKRKLARPPRGA